MTTFSVVIATKNRAALLAQTLESLQTQTWPRQHFEVIVADNGSTDDTRAVVEAAAARPRAPAIHYLFVASPGKSGAVNAAVARSRQDVIAYTDDDTRPDARWLERIAAAIDETGADFVAGRVLPIWEAPRPSWLSSDLYGVLAVPDNGDRRLSVALGEHTEVMTIGANMAVARTVVGRVGGLCTDLGKLEGTLRGGEDHELFLRMIHSGCRGVYEPTAVVHHWVPASRLSRAYFRRWLYRNGRDVARVEPSFPSATAQLWRLPRYLWRQAASDMYALTIATVSRNEMVRFRAGGRLLWFAGYLRETWHVQHRSRHRTSWATESEP